MIDRRKQTYAERNLFLCHFVHQKSEMDYRGADKSLARPGRKQANVSVRMAWISFGALPCRKKKIDDSSRLDVAEIARVPDMLPSLFPFWSGYGLISTTVQGDLTQDFSVK